MKCVDKSNQPAPNLPSPVSAEWYYCCWSVASCGVVADWFPLQCSIRYPRYSSFNLRLHSVLETHLDWRLLNFWQEWIIQIHAFDKIPGHSQFLATKAKKGSDERHNWNWKSSVCCFDSFSHMKRRHLLREAYPKNIINCGCCVQQHKKRGILSNLNVW